MQHPHVRHKTKPFWVFYGIFCAWVLGILQLFDVVVADNRRKLMLKTMRNTQRDSRFTTNPISAWIGRDDMVLQGESGAVHPFQCGRNLDAVAAVDDRKDSIEMRYEDENIS